MALGLTLAACATTSKPMQGVSPPPPPPPDRTASVLPDWRGLILPEDRDRYQRREAAWTLALEQARTLQGSGDLKALGKLIDPAASLPNPSIPVGDYRCRTIKLGSQIGLDLGYVVYGWFNCRVTQTDAGVRLVKLTGSQRVEGLFYPENDRHMILLGAMALSSEVAAPAYGQRTDRSVAAILERIDERQWRLVTPWPHAESYLDILELVPAR